MSFLHGYAPPTFCPKIGGGDQGDFALFPDQMGTIGETMAHAIEH